MLQRGYSLLEAFKKQERNSLQQPSWERLSKM